MKAKQAHKNLSKVINKEKLNILSAHKETTMEYLLAEHRKAARKNTKANVVWKNYLWKLWQSYLA